MATHRHIATAFLLLWSGVAFAQAGDPTPGRQLAQSLCGACHRIDDSLADPSPNPDAPPFARIARMGEMTDLAIKVFLRSPHPTMPNFLLSDNEIDGVTAYIRALGGK